MRPLRRWLLVVAALAGMGCAGATDVTSVRTPDGTSLALSVESLDVAANSSRQAIIRVTSPAGGSRLSLGALPVGVTAHLSPLLLPAGDARSVVTVSVDSSARPGSTRLTINASSAAGTSVATIQATASLLVVVPEPPPNDCPGCPFKVGGSNVLSGLVLERSDAGTRPLGGARVSLSIQTPAYGYGRSAVTSASGEYRFERLENAHIFATGWGTGYDQPCATEINLNSPTATANVELVWPGDAKVDTNPAGPALMGVVYETTPTGRKPMAGVRVYFDWWMESIVATTTTDELGRYSLCRLPTTEAAVWLSKDGYVLTETPVKVSGVTIMDLEMKRQ